MLAGSWMQRKDGDPVCRDIFDRHYSRYFYKDGRKPKLFVGPGEKMVLLHTQEKALCVWRKFISKDNQQGINCAIFRNESEHRASELLLEAMHLAWDRWPGERLYTYVSPKGVRPTMERGKPVWCFYKAGWRFCGVTKVHGHHSLERSPV
jgi:hypothetical protein